MTTHELRAETATLAPPLAAARAIRLRSPGRAFPDFDLTEFRPRRSRHCICVFVLNEGERIRGQLRRMAPLAERFDVVVADGGSSDGALEPALLVESAVRALLVKRGPGRLSAQMRMAFAYALDEGYEGIVVIDGNGKDDVEAIPEFVRLLDEGYDHVQGSRFIPGGCQRNTPLARLAAIRLLHAPLVSLAARRRYTDTTNGFRAYSGRLLADARIDVFRDVFSSYEIHPYLAIESARAGFRSIETPVTRCYPSSGKTPTKISPIRGNTRFLVILFKATFRRYRGGRA